MEQIILALRNDRVQVAVGKPGATAVVRGLYEEYLRTDDRISGWEEAVRRLWEREHLPRGRVQLILPGGTAIVQSLKLPPMRRNQLSQAVQNEMQYNVDHKLITDYIPAGREKSGAWHVLTCSCLLEEMRYFPDMMKRLKLKLKCVTASAEPLLRLLRATLETQNRSLIFLCFDETYLLWVLIEDGVCRRVSCTPLRKEPGSVHFAEEAAQSVLNSIRLRNARRIEKLRPPVYLAGCTDNVFQRCGASFHVSGFPVRAMPACERIRGIPKEKPIHNWLSCVGALLK